MFPRARANCVRRPVSACETRHVGLTYMQLRLKWQAMGPIRAHVPDKRTELIQMHELGSARAGHRQGRGQGQGMVCPALPCPALPCLALLVPRARATEFVHN